MPWPPLYGRPFTCTRLHLLWLPPRSHLLYCHCSFFLLPCTSWSPTHLNPLPPSCVSMLCEAKNIVWILLQFNPPQLENWMSVASCQYQRKSADLRRAPWYRTHVERCYRCWPAHFTGCLLFPFSNQWAKPSGFYKRENNGKFLCNWFKF